MKTVAENISETNELHWHKKMAVDCFNQTWDLMDKEDRTEYDTLKMIHTAHTSVYHWSYIGEPINQARGEWQVSRAYSLAGMGESALYHAKFSLNICQAAGMAGFDLAFAYEALARASKVLGDQNGFTVWKLEAVRAAQLINSEDDRNYCLSEINSI